MNLVVLLDEKKKKKEEEGTSKRLERHNGNLFCLLFMRVPFNFFILQAQWRQPQIKAAHAV